MTRRARFSRLAGGLTRSRAVGPGFSSLEDDADHDLAVTVDLVEDAGADALAVEETADRRLELENEEVHLSNCD